MALYEQIRKAHEREGLGVRALARRFGVHRLLCAIQVHEVVLPVSMAELRARFEWSTLRVYELNAPGQNHGILLGTRGWASWGL